MRKPSDPVANPIPSPGDLHSRRPAPILPCTLFAPLECDTASVLPYSSASVMGAVPQSVRVQSRDVARAGLKLDTQAPCDIMVSLRYRGIYDSHR